MSYEIIVPKKIILGKDAIKNSKEDLKTLGKKALIVTDETMVKLGNINLLENILKEINIEYIVYSEINSEPTTAMVEKGTKIYRENKCDFFIAIGGGSPIDATKAIAVIAQNGGKIENYMGKIIEGNIAPIVAIPTTAGTGSEATQFTIITDEEKNIKMLLKGKILLPQLAIVDPIFTITIPPKVTAATGLDALTHAIEAYTSKKANPISDNFALSSVKRIFEYLPICFKDGNNFEAREQMVIASLEAGIAFNNSSITIIHGMSRPIGALFHVPHGISNAMLMEECFKFALDGAFERFGALAKQIGIEEEDNEKASNKFLLKLKELCEVLEIPTLEQYGIDKNKFFENIDKMANDAILSGSPANTIKNVSENDIKKIYKNLWK